MKVHISDNQRSKIQQAVEKGEPVSIRLTYEDLQGNDVAFTTSQLNKIAEAFNNRKGITIKMSKTQVEHNKQIEGGFILPLLGAVASAVLPSLASMAVDRITCQRGSARQCSKSHMHFKGKSSFLTPI
jgi:2,4-dienoyl-CoA reductase-like NADH-dependent reductase (Old Yellow Enzyme family)